MSRVPGQHGLLSPHEFAEFVGVGLGQLVVFHEQLCRVDALEQIEEDFENDDVLHVKFFSHARRDG
jgi:hypothetical protein